MLSCGIVGLPNVGKSTLFNALLKRQQALVANYPFATIEPNVGVVPVPDERLDKLADVVMNGDDSGRGQNDGRVRPPIIPATVRFVDIAGLVKGASQGEGLGNQFLSHIREVEAIAQVVRNFSDENIIRSGSINPKADIEVVNTELVLADLQTLENQKSKIKDQNDKSKFKNSIIEKLKEQLNSGKLVSQLKLNDEEKALLKDLNLLTAKPFIYLLNSDESKVAELSFQNTSTVIASDLPAQVGARQSLTNASQDAHSGEIATGRTPRDDIVYMSAKLEAELSALSEEEQRAYLAELNIKESGLDKVTKKAYETLGLVTFLTAGPKEVRAWTVKKGSKTPQAAGTIHSDFERGFIAAEVISYEDLIKAGSFKKAGDFGKIRLEGKDYEMKDGDVVEFRFSI